MPRTSTSSAMIASSLISGQRCTWIEPSAKCWARSAMYSVLRSDRPQARSRGLGLARIACGVTAPAQATTRSHTLCAALTEICCPTMARASVMKGSPRRTRKIFGCARMMAAMTGSRRARARLARLQYSGFIQRKIEQQVLRLHPHHRVLGGQREIDVAARDVGAHGGRILEAQHEQRENVAHAPGVDLVAGPELVQDRGGLGVEPDVPGPARLLDLADGRPPDAQRQEVPDPFLQYASKGVERRPPVGEAHHRVVLRLALPVESGVGAVQHVEVRGSELARSEEHTSELQSRVDI